MTSLDLPSTELADRAYQLVAGAEQSYLRNHSVRTFLYGRAAAAAKGIRPGEHYDDELVFLISLFHDIGLTEFADTGRRFEVDGADFAAAFLENNGVTDHRVDVIWDAIALHTTPHLHDSPVFRKRRAPEIGVAQSGIGIDVWGGPRDLPDGYAELVHGKYPREGGSRALGDTMAGHAKAQPHRAPPRSLAGDVLHQRYPELPYVTWNDNLAASGWQD